MNQICFYVTGQTIPIKITYPDQAAALAQFNEFNHAISVADWLKIDLPDGRQAVIQVVHITSIFLELV